MSKTNPTAPAAEPDAGDAETGIEHTNTAPHGVETSLGGVTREQVRADSPIYREIVEAITFHMPADGPGSGSAAQLVRDVLGSIARAATPGGIVKRPVNRPAELREFPAAALRQLAALCRVWAPGDEVETDAPLSPEAAEHLVGRMAELNGTPHELSHEEQRETATPEPIVPVSVSPAPPVPGQAEQVAEIERNVVTERANGSGTVTTIAGPPIPPVFHAPEPYRPELDAAYEIPPAELVAPAYVFHAPEPYRADAPPSPMSPAGDDIPF